MIPLETDTSFLDHSKLLCDSYFKWIGEPLLENHNHNLVRLSEALYQAPFVVVSHGIEADPIFNYANLKAQELWKMSWDKFTTLPSSHSAEPVNREVRQQIMKEVESHGHIKDYNGIRITSDGLRFRIRNTVIWNVVNDNGKYLGQAATFKEWDWL